MLCLSASEQLMSAYALLHRLSPNHWPTWESTIVPDQNAEVWFRTGRRRAENIHPGIPVVVLGTEGLGVVGYGETISGVKFRPDPDWRGAAPEYQKGYRKPDYRVCVSIRRVRVPLEKIRSRKSISRLHRTARETTTWLRSDQYHELMLLVHKA